MLLITSSNELKSWYLSVEFVENIFVCKLKSKDLRYILGNLTVKISDILWKIDIFIEIGKS